MSISVSVFQSLSTTSVYSHLDGDLLEHGEPVPSEGFYALLYRPWIVSIQERDSAGVWQMIHYSAPHMRKEHALAECERLGVVPSYVSHHQDYVHGMVCGR